MTPPNIWGVVLACEGDGGGDGRGMPRTPGLPYAFHAAMLVLDALEGRMAGIIWESSDSAGSRSVLMERVVTWGRRGQAGAGRGRQGPTLSCL